MSQPDKRDIAEFFRPHAKPIVPRKRPSPGSDGRTSVARSTTGTPQTPSTSRSIKLGQSEQDVSTPSESRVRALATPKSGRRLSIPIRSPATPTTVRTTPRPEPASLRLKDSAEPSASFSFVDLPTSSSRQIHEGGKLVAVRDSDEEDNESLESLADIFDRKKDGDELGSSQTTSKQEEERVRMLGVFTGGRSNPILKKDRMRDLQRLEQANKFDLSHIFEEERREAKARARIAKANAELEELTRELEAAKQEEIDKKLLAAILQGNTAEEADPEDIARLMTAVDRTEALSGDKSFSFFGRVGFKDLSTQKRPRLNFPTDAIPGQLWGPKDNAARDRAYLSGFITELAASGRIDDRAIRWTFDSAFWEPRDDLRESYVNCVSTASPTWTRAHVTPEDVQHIFAMLGADVDALRDGSEIRLQYRPKSSMQKQNHKHLAIALKILIAICQDLDFATLSKLASTICRLSLDQDVMYNNQACQLVEDLLNLLTNLPDTQSRQHVQERLISDLTTNIQEPALQAQFLQHFVPTTSSAASLRQNLARRFLFGTEAAQMLAMSKEPLDTIANHLRHSPYFTTTRSKSRLESAASFSYLTNLTIILDAAIADGYPPPNFATRADEQSYDAQVDELADHIHSLFVNIADTGASHMRRTEAKDVLQALHHRLLLSVRTRVKRKKHVFDAHGN